jgi:hypothetical protein
MTDPAPRTPSQLAALLDASRTAIVAEMAALGRHATERLIEGAWCERGGRALPSSWS